MDGPGRRRRSQRRFRPMPTRTHAGSAGTRGMRRPRRSPGRSRRTAVGAPVAPIAPCGRGRWKIGWPGIGRPGIGRPVFPSDAVRSLPEALADESALCIPDAVPSAARSIGAAAAVARTAYRSLRLRRRRGNWCLRRNRRRFRLCSHRCFRFSFNRCGWRRRLRHNNARSLTRLRRDESRSRCRGVADNSCCRSRFRLRCVRSALRQARPSCSTGAGGTAGAFGAAAVFRGGSCRFGCNRGSRSCNRRWRPYWSNGFGAVTGAAGAVARGGATGACCFSRIAFNASPGFEMCEKSNFGFSPSSAGLRATDLCPPSPPCRKCAFTFSASSTLMELEWVFFSVTPTCVRTSRIALLLTSSSLARSLIRILSTIRPRFFLPQTR